MNQHKAFLAGLRLPVVAAPMFLVSTPPLLIAQCRAGIVGSMPALNARPSSQLDEWLAEIRETLLAHDKTSPATPAAPFAVNLIVNKTNTRVDEDLALCEKYKVPLVITSLGVRPEVNQAVRAWGGTVLHDVINNSFAHKAIDKGAHGLIAVAAGAGGHAGTRSPFALLQEIRSWFDGPLGLGGAIATGGGVLAAQAMGADFAYLGSAFIATQEGAGPDAYKQAVVDGNSDDIVYSDYFSGIHANFLKQSIRAAGLDPDALPARDDGTTGLRSAEKRAWKDIWSAGHGIGAVQSVTSTAALVARLETEYRQARMRLGLAQGSGAAAAAG